jgi:hypothetical protein
VPGRARNRILDNQWTPDSHGRHGLKRKQGGIRAHLTLMETTGNVPSWCSRWNVGKSWSAGVSPAKTNAGKMPALRQLIKQNGLRADFPSVLFPMAGLCPADVPPKRKRRTRFFRSTTGTRKGRGSRGKIAGKSIVRRRPLTGVCRRRRSSARHSCRVSVGQRHGARPVDGPSRWGGLEPDGFHKDIKMSCNHCGELGQSGATGSRRMRKRPEHRPQIPQRGRLARHDQCGQDARAPQRNRPKRRHREKPRERGFRFATGAKPRPGVKRRAEDRLRRTRPVNGPWHWPIP